MSARRDAHLFRAWRRRERLAYWLSLGEVFLGLYAFTITVLTVSVLVSP